MKRNTRLKLMVEVTHSTDGTTEYEELRPCCERIARFRGECQWYDVVMELMQAAEQGASIQTMLAHYRLVVEVHP